MAIARDKCIRCDKRKPIPGRVRCRVCTRKEKVKYQKLKDAGLCIKCGSKAFGDYVNCLSCIKAASMKRIRSSI